MNITPEEAQELADKIKTAVLDQIEKDRFHPMSENIKMVVAAQLLAAQGANPGSKLAATALGTYSGDDVIRLCGESMQLIYEVVTKVHPATRGPALDNAIRNTREALKRFGMHV